MSNMNGEPAIPSMVGVAWLKEQLDEKRANVQVIDASYDLTRNVKDEYFKIHIPGAVFFDIKECRDKSLPYPNMLPPPQVFAQYVGSLGIDNKMHIIVYDNNPRGLFSATRVWWMFRAFGHEKVSILNGGLVSWIRNGFPRTNEVHPRPAKVFHATLRKEYLKTYQDVIEIVKSSNESPTAVQLVDARYLNPGLEYLEKAYDFLWCNSSRPPTLFSAGHMPKAKSFPYFSVLNDPQTAFTVKEDEALQKAFTAASIDLERPIVFHCTSGVAACMLFFAASLLGRKPPDIAVYDGSWGEWEPRSRGHHELVEYV